MGVYAQTSKAWRGLEIGEKITATQMRERLGLGEDVRATVSGFLSREVSSGRAVKEGHLNGLVLYRLIAAPLALIIFIFTLVVYS